METQERYWELHHTRKSWYSYWETGLFFGKNKNQKQTKTPTKPNKQQQKNPKPKPNKKQQHNNQNKKPTWSNMTKFVKKVI